MTVAPGDVELLSPRVVDSSHFAPSSSRTDIVGPFVVFLLVTIAVLPWRTKVYFSGAIDPVVIAKAAISLAGLGLAVAVGSGRKSRPVPAAPSLFLVAYLTCTVLGGWAAGSLVPSAVVAARVILVAVTVLLLVRRFDSQRLVGCMLAAFGCIGLLGALTGLTNLTDGRLGGRWPYMHPNELANASALVIIWCLWRMLTASDSLLALVAFGVAAAVLLATGSRTPLLALALSAALMVLYVHSVRVRTAVLTLILAPLAVWLVMGTSLLRQLVLRNQDVEQISTLSNRTIAWSAALAPKSSPWMEWLGGGLTLKQIQVEGQWWNQQILDSSWVSALVQGGFIGLFVCLAWVASGFVRTFDTSLPFRALQQALLVYLVFRGVLESGLFDASSSFLVFFVTLMATPVVAAAASGDLKSDH